MSRKNPFGYTLIELLIAVAVVAIAAGISYPIYQDYVMKSRRAAVKGAMLQLSQYMERNYTEVLRYNLDATSNSTITIGDVIDASLPEDLRGTLEDHYTLSFSALSNTAYSIQAQPKAGQDDDDCGTLILSGSGNRTADEEDCW